MRADLCGCVRTAGWALRASAAWHLTADAGIARRAQLQEKQLARVCQIASKPRGPHRMSGSLEENLCKASRYLERFRSAPLGHFIEGGQVRTDNAATFANLSPVDGSLLCHVIAGEAA